jgi:Sulfotransferase domain
MATEAARAAQPPFRLDHLERLQVSRRRHRPTYGKSGTTWVQQIVAQLLFNGAEDVAVAELSPWLDLRVPPKEVKLERSRRKPIAASSNTSADRCPRVLAARKIRLYRPRRARCDLQYITITPTPMSAGTRR